MNVINIICKRVIKCKGTVHKIDCDCNFLFSVDYLLSYLNIEKHSYWKNKVVVKFRLKSKF